MSNSREIVERSQSPFKKILSPPVLFDAVMKKVLILEGYELEKNGKQETKVPAKGRKKK